MDRGVDASRPSLFEAAVRLHIGVIRWGGAAVSLATGAPAVLWTHGAQGSTGSAGEGHRGIANRVPYAYPVAEQLGSDLARRNFTVISGLAHGVDGAAHRGAWAGDGLTVGVLGSGVEVVYAREHATLATTVAAPGGAGERVRSRSATPRASFPAT